MQNSIQLEFAAGWWRDCPPTEYARLKCEVVREISEFGYRLPVLWYVHEQNVNHIPELISESLQANYDSGFKLSMVSSNPYYNFDPLDPPVPISDAYCDLLIQCFENYRQYDGILEPYAELLEVVLRGGWHSSLNTPPMINLLLRPNVPIGLHLHIPHRAVSWLELSEIKDMSCDAILNNLVKHYQTMFDLRENTFCQRCSWRYVCGGIDANTDQSLLVEKARTAICDHRLFLLQFLTYLRINNSLTSSDLAKRMNR